MLIDTHAHLNFKAFKKNLDNVLWQAREAGIKKIIVPGADLETSKKAVSLATSYENIYAAVGIHPHNTLQIKSQKSHFDKLRPSALRLRLEEVMLSKVEASKVKSELLKLAQNNKVVAIGECGLDYHSYKKTKHDDYKIDRNFKKIQKEIFILQLELAQELKMPVIFHCRKAHEDMIKILKGSRPAGRRGFGGQVKGVFHCFSGDEKFLKWVLKKGFYVGFDGNITYHDQWQKIIKKTPLKKILLETDAPFLIPEPLRSQKIFPNTPENIKIVAETIAKIKGDSFLKVARQTTKNAKKLFGFEKGQTLQRCKV